jgi:hypothetical protein
MSYTSVWSRVNTEDQKRKAASEAKRASEKIREYEMKMFGVMEKLGYYDAQIKRIVRKNLATLKANRRVNGKFIKYELLVLLCLNTNTKIFPQLEDYFVRKGYAIYKKNDYGIYTIYKGRRELCG